MSDLISEKFYQDAEAIVAAGRYEAYRSVSAAMVETYWMLGRRIVEEEQNGQARADYGTYLIAQLSKRLTQTCGKGFSRRQLFDYKKFYLTFPDLPKVQTRLHFLTWSHYRCLMRVPDEKARQWYMNETVSETWSVRTLDRNISTLYYERLLMSQNQEPVREEMQEKTKEYQADRLEFIKNPVVAEFLGLSSNADFTETELEQRIITQIQKFLMEMGKGYAFVARQQHIRTDIEDYFIDLVFYNYILKCFVLIDLKCGEITHQDVGQMDMYLRMYDELKRGDGDSPTLGIILCSETNRDIARYSILHDNDHLFAAKYRLYLPDEQELRSEIERQKEIYRLQQAGLEED